jgi:hypothetical protein
MIENRIGIIGVIFFLIGLSLLVWLLYMVIKGESERGSALKKFLEKVWGKIVIFIVALFFLFLAKSFFQAQDSLKSFFLYYPNKLIAEIKLEPKKEMGQFIVSSTTFGDKGERFTETFFLPNQSCKLGAEILLFDSFFKGFGFVSKYKIYKLESSPNNSSSTLSTSFDISGGSDSFWEKVNGLGKILPFVKAKKLETEYINLEIGKPVKVFIEKNKLRIE